MGFRAVLLSQLVNVALQPISITAVVIISFLYTYRKHKLLDYKALSVLLSKLLKMCIPCITCIYWLDKKIIIKAEKDKD